jgi:hypothetical protein
MATLESRLDGFTRQVAGRLPFSECVRLHSVGALELVSYEGAEGTPQCLTFQWEVLDIERYSSGDVALVATHVCDDRPSGLGSAYTPLCGGARISENGTVDYLPMGNGAAATSVE